MAANHYCHIPTYPYIIINHHRLRRPITLLYHWNIRSLKNMVPRVDIAIGTHHNISANDRTIRDMTVYTQAGIITNTNVKTFPEMSASFNIDILSHRFENHLAKATPQPARKLSSNFRITNWEVDCEAIVQSKAAIL